MVKADGRAEGKFLPQSPEEEKECEVEEMPGSPPAAVRRERAKVCSGGARSLAL